MRKADPKYLKKQYSDETDRMLAYFDRISNALRGTPKEKSDMSHLSESLFMDAYVSFEWFISKLFVAYMNHDFQPYQNDLAQRISMSLKEKFGIWAESRTKYGRIAHVPVDRIEEMVEPDSKLITFVNSDRMIEVAKKWIAAKYNKGIIGMSAVDRVLIDTSRSIRHYIAHGSDKAYATMNENLATIDNGPQNRGLGRGKNEIDNVGAFLKSQTTGDRRIQKYLKRLRDISGTM